MQFERLLNNVRHDDEQVCSDIITIFVSMFSSNNVHWNKYNKSQSKGRVSLESRRSIRHHCRSFESIESITKTRNLTNKSSDKKYINKNNNFYI